MAMAMAVADGDATRDASVPPPRARPTAETPQTPPPPAPAASGASGAVTPPPPPAGGSARDGAGTSSAADGSALDRLQLLSRLLLEIDADATMDVSMAGDFAYEVHAVTLGGRTSTAASAPSDKTNVRKIAQAVRQAVALGHGGAGGGV